MNSNMKSHWTRTPLLLTAALLASCLLTAWMAVHGFYINTCLAALLTLGIAWAVCRYMKHTSRLMEQFIQSVRYSGLVSLDYLSGALVENQDMVVLIQDP